MPWRAPRLPSLDAGVQPEWRGKQALCAIGVRVPDGKLALTVDEALEVAGQVGYPVALKAQAADLPHKAEVGGVVLNIAGPEALRSGWTVLHDNVGRARPDLRIDGVLVEAMIDRGVELFVGGRRDPEWGPFLLAGTGGAQVELINDVRCFPADLTEEAIIEELYKLKVTRLLQHRAAGRAMDIVAAAHTIRLIGDLILHNPEVLELDINPLMAHEPGAGTTAVDVLLVINR
jgi:succinyl-CoA synthetase beta subunit